MKKVILGLIAISIIGFIVWLFFMGNVLFQKYDSQTNSSPANTKNNKSDLPPQIVTEIVSPDNGDPKVIVKEKEKEVDKSLLTHEVELILQLPEKATIYSLEPKYIERILTGEELFDNYKVLGKSELTSEEMAIAIHEVEKFALESDQSLKSVCFSPVIGLQITSGKKFVDFLISFDCTRMQIHSNTKVKFKEIIINAKPDELNKILEKYNMPFKKPSEVK